MLNLLQSSRLAIDQPLRIAGAGIAGMTAALQLRRFGREVLIIEKQTQVGGSRHGDLEGIENWIFPVPLSKFFANHGIDFERITSTPSDQFTVDTAAGSSFVIRSRIPFFHIVRRGADKGCIDAQLYRQCKEAGVRFKCGSMATADVHIDSTGANKAVAYIKGINFTSSLPDQIHLLLGEKFAPKGYGYLIINGGRGTVAAAYKKLPQELGDPLENTITHFQRLNIFIEDGKQFASRGSFSLPINRGFTFPLKVGEAGGYQDYLFGFGLRMAMMSGSAAAKYISGDIRNARKLLHLMNRKCKMSFLNRILYERLSDDQMAYLAQRLATADQPLYLLRQAYQWNFRKVMRWIKMSNRYEVRPD